MSSNAHFHDLIARRDPALAAFGATLVLVAALGVQAARLGWALATPLGPLGEAPPPQAPAAASANFALLDRFDPFHRGASTGLPANGGAAGTLRLFGVRVGRQSSAIIGAPDGRQVSVLVGEEVAPGVTLRTVAADHVELLVQGRRTTLAFQAPAPGSAYAPPAPPTIQPTAGPAEGATLPPDSMATADLARAGLQPGDVVISVNGQSVSDSQSVETLGRDLAGGREAVVQYQRDGQVRTATLRIPTP